METDLAPLAQALIALGCPAASAMDMAGHLDRRARQLSEATGKSHDEAMVHLLRMMASGWAAQAAGVGFPPPPAEPLPGAP
jgi:hypothetical protein